jgi:hypothetical protein
LNGAIVEGDGDRMLRYWDMPTMLDGKRHSVDQYALVDLFMELRPRLVGIELLRPRPKGAIAAFKLGAGMAAANTAAYASGAVVKLLAPNAWKSEYGFAVGDKDAPRQELLRRFPDAQWLKRVKDQDRADAYFIGLLAMQQHEADAGR